MYPRTGSPDRSIRCRYGFRSVPTASRRQRHVTGRHGTALAGSLGHVTDLLRCSTCPGLADYQWRPAQARETTLPTSAVSGRRGPLNRLDAPTVGGVHSWVRARTESHRPELSLSPKPSTHR